MLHSFDKDVVFGNLKKKPFDIVSIWNVGKVGGMTQWKLMKCRWQMRIDKAGTKHARTKGVAP